MTCKIAIYKKAKHIVKFQALLCGLVGCVDYRKSAFLMQDKFITFGLSLQSVFILCYNNENLQKRENDMKSFIWVSLFNYRLLK